jgi:hypothetical protein
MIDVDVFPSDTSWLSEPTTGVHLRFSQKRDCIFAN